MSESVTEPPDREHPTRTRPVAAATSQPRAQEKTSARNQPAFPPLTLIQFSPCRFRHLSARLRPHGLRQEVTHWTCSAPTEDETCGPIGTNSWTRTARCWNECPPTSIPALIRHVPRHISRHATIGSARHTLALGCFLWPRWRSRKNSDFRPT